MSGIARFISETKPKHEAIEGRNAPIERSLVRTVIEHLQELTPPQMEHKLRINTEIIRQPKARRVLLSIIGKLLTKPDEHSVQPPQHIRAIVDLCLEHRDTRHQHCGSLLVKGGRDGRRASFGKVSRDSGDA